jgi:predicted RNase H-like HicB family nuclease
MEVALAEMLHIDVHLEDGSLWAIVEELPGVFATGDTLEELRESLEEGISLYLAEPNGDAPSVRLDALQSGSTVTSAQLAYV